MVLTRRQTAAAPRPAPPRWAELPGDVLRRVAAGAQKLMPRGRPGFWDDRPVEDPPLLLRDVLSAACACGAWRRALASPDLGRLSIGGAT